MEYLSWRVWFMKRTRERVRKEEGRRIAAQLQLDDDSVQVDLDEDERVEIASLSSDLDNKAFTKVVCDACSIQVLRNADDIEPARQALSSRKIQEYTMKLLGKDTVFFQFPWCKSVR